MIRLALVAALLSGCVRNLGAIDCRDEAIDNFKQSTDRITRLQRLGLIDQDTAADYLALEALHLRRTLVEGCH